MPTLKPPIDPALLKHEQERAEARQNRAGDRITAFSGSMTFVYLHIFWFSCSIGFGVESYPFGLLTMIVTHRACSTRGDSPAGTHRPSLAGIQLGGHQRRRFESCRPVSEVHGWTGLGRTE